MPIALKLSALTGLCTDRLCNGTASVASVRDERALSRPQIVTRNQRITSVRASQLKREDLKYRHVDSRSDC